MTVRLGKDQWIGAGLRALAREGIEGVRVERLASSLGLTKGSFYWHFADRSALHSAMLEEWAARATGEVIARVEGKGGGASEKLLNLIRIVVADDGRVDRAVRGWAAHDALAGAATDRVDQWRVAYLCGLFSGLGFSERESLARSRMIYQAVIGQIMMVAAAPRDERIADWVDVIFPMLVYRPANQPELGRKSS